MIVTGLARLRTALDRLDIDAIARAALAEQGEVLAADIRDSLGHAPGEDHTTPWRQTGTLQDSIAVMSNDDGAVVGSSDLVSIHQEQGTRTVPPRPFLAPAAARNAPDLAEVIGTAVARALEKAVR